MAEKFYPFSPYNYGLNSPIIMVDPDGRAASPIYDPDGNLLGTDDQGVQGKAIVMEKDKFKQGMTHDDEVGEERPIQLLFPWASDDGRIYGNLQMKLQKGGRVNASYDDNDFDNKKI